ncbi:MAG: hypothetical protein P8P74_17820 [Crocinitomicaceae bacterium]|nr:hypothetical protein [Crocinitomicaceae bacterium]
MRSHYLLLLFLGFALNSSGQNKDRVTLAGSRVSVLVPANTLIPKHTSTIYIDSSIECMVMEFPNVELVKDWMKNNTYPLDGPDIKESFNLKVHQGEAKVHIAEFNTVKDIIYAYVGDSTYGIITSCIYKRTAISVKQRVQDLIESMRIIDDPEVDWHSYLSFEYDRSNRMELLREKYTSGMRFTPNGELNDSLFNATNITALQFPPAPSVKTSKDLLMAGISGRLLDVEIGEVVHDGAITINGHEAYKFWAKCSNDGVDFEWVFVAFFDAKSSVVVDCHIINDEYQDDVYEFVNSIELKRDGY